jgi:hypothetical protein
MSDLLGAPSRTTLDLDEYPASGVTVWFRADGQAVKFNFAGKASRLYSVDRVGLIPTERSVLFGLTGHADEADFVRALGLPASDGEERAAAVSERRRVWRRNGYVIDALFLVMERNQQGRTYPGGTLVWFEVSRGI